MLTVLQSLPLCSPSQTLLLSRDATSSVKLAESSSGVSMAVLWPETLVAQWSLECSAGASAFAVLVSSA